jgi:hypothetical protein
MTIAAECANGRSIPLDPRREGPADHEIDGAFATSPAIAARYVPGCLDTN